MKKLIAAVLAGVLLLSAAGCGAKQETEPQETAPKTTYKVPSPKKTPDYSVPENYTTDDLRAIAVRAMHDFVTIEWTADKYYTYRNPYDAVDKQFQYVPNVTYGGLPYTNAHTGIFQWYKFYDQETGVMSFPGDGMAWSQTLGNVCACTIIWCWSTVCNSLAGNYNSYQMTVPNHFVPVGDYKMNTAIESYRDYTTDKICADNGDTVMYESYAKVLPADALTSSPDAHAVMAMEAANVVRNADGTIDPEQSTIKIMDQRGSVGDESYKHQIDGVDQWYTGRVGYEYTFAKLLSLGYIPVTAAEFTGAKEYTKPVVSFSGKTDSLKDLLTGKVKTNYLLCNLELFLTEADGTETRLALAQYNKKDAGMGCGADTFHFDMGKIRDANVQEQLEGMKISEGAAIRLVAQVSSGDIFEIAKIPAEAK